ncbi:MAG: hypothetical protein P4L99_27820 [Chthoniobacter sp.]|nr:hypothetical protein [Chthoniobacter sp.]
MPRFLLANLFCLLLLGVSARANLLTNGDFELSSPQVAVGSDANVAPGQPTTLTGWTTALGTGGSGPGIYMASAGSAGWIPNPQHGNFALQLDSTNTGTFTTGNSINQSVTLAANTTYWLTFSINTEIGAGKGGTSGIDVTITNPSAVKIVNAVEFTVTSGAAGSSPAATTPWATYQIQFKTSTAGSYNFKFQDALISGNSNISIDNVGLDTVPEYSHWLIFMGFGATCVVVEMRRRRVLAV